nr:hypothetical protein Itr_chr04CG08780 [Ipomoea trifida]
MKNIRVKLYIFPALSTSVVLSAFNTVEYDNFLCSSDGKKQAAPLKHSGGAGIRRNLPNHSLRRTLPLVGKSPEFSAFWVITILSFSIFLGLVFLQCSCSIKDCFFHFVLHNFEKLLLIYMCVSSWR